MILEKEIRSEISKALNVLFNLNIESPAIVLQQTRKEFAGDTTLVTFPFAKPAALSPEETGKRVGEWLLENSAFVKGFNQVKGFLNLEIKDHFFFEALSQFKAEVAEASRLKSDGPVLVEYSSPNTNKPLHLGHIRNILLGFSIAKILEAAGYKVVKVSLVNDRGIHICKSMLAWMKFGNGETPESSQTKGDHLVGKYYVEFDKAYKKEIETLVQSGVPKEEAEKKAPVMLEAKEMLRKWEAGDAATLDLWKRMNNWVYSGFDITYKSLGVSFERMYYESETYLLGKALVDEGLQKGVFYKKDDGSVWIDLTDEGLDQKLLLRSDGTSVYITQDIGTAKQRFSEYQFTQLIYVVGNEQDYHFKVLKSIVKKLGFGWWNALQHMSYNMVDLPSGKMKSREGTVVDADDIINETISDAEKMTRELGKLDDYDGEVAQQLYKTIGLGALKFFILRVDPEKRMLFNPQESIDINGFTGPFVQYTYARTRSVIRKAATLSLTTDAMQFDEITFNNHERALLKLILEFENIVLEAAQKLSPALIANYAFELAKTYNQFYHENVIIDSGNKPQSQFRLKLNEAVADAIKNSFLLLGIDVPEKM